MRKLFRLLYFLLFVFLAYNYFQNNREQVMGWLAIGEEWISEHSNLFKEAVKTLEPEKTKTEVAPKYVSPERNYIPVVPSESKKSKESNQNRETTSSAESSYRRSTLQSSISITSGNQEVDEKDASPPLSTPTYLKAGTPKENFEWIKAVTEKHSPDTWQMLMKYEMLPTSEKAPSHGGSTISSQKPVTTFHYLEGRSHLELLASMRVNVHELAHAYFRHNTYSYARNKNMLLDWEKVQGYIYITPRTQHFVSYPKKVLFPSKRLTKVIPPHLITFRHDTYIDGNTSTQSQGIIGLLDEFHAYYLGSKYNFDMLEAYKQAAGSETKGLCEWARNTMSSMTAFYEFDFFIREYLLYLLQQDEATYLLLRDTGEFRDAYATIYSHFDKLTKNYYALIQKEMEQINTQDLAEIWIKDEHLWVRENNSRRSSGTPIYGEDRKILLPVLKSDRYKKIKLDFLGGG